MVKWLVGVSMMRWLLSIVSEVGEYGEVISSYYVNYQSQDFNQIIVIHL